MLFNIWKTCTVCLLKYCPTAVGTGPELGPRGRGPGGGNRVALRATVWSLSAANTLFIRLSVCLFIWLSNYPSRQTAPRVPNVNNTLGLTHALAGGQGPPCGDRLGFILFYLFFMIWHVEEERRNIVEGIVGWIIPMCKATHAFCE